MRAQELHERLADVAIALSLAASVNYLLLIPVAAILVWLGVRAASHASAGEAACIVATSSPRALGKLMLFTLATHAPRNSRPTGGGEMFDGT